MTVGRMDHVGVVVDDLDAAIDFFVALGLEPVGRGEVEGGWVDRVIGLEGVRSRIAMLQVPGGGTMLELSQFTAPTSPDADHDAPSNVPGLRHVAFTVDDVDATVARLREHGARLVGDVVRVPDGSYRLCYVRGPQGIIVELAQPLG